MLISALPRRLCPFRSVALAFVALAFAQALLAQTPQAPNPIPTPGPPPKALILGRVLDADTNRPVSGATVMLASETATPAANPAVGPPAFPRRVLTGTDGLFLFRDLPKGKYTLTATSQAYLAGAFGQRRPAGASQPLVLETDQRLGNVEIRMWKEATLAGAVTDESGSPVVGISVWLARRETRGARGSMKVKSSAGADRPIFTDARTARTDDRGAFQFSGLTPGEYVVSVANRVIQLPPGLADADAATLQTLRSTGASSMASGVSWLGPAARVGDVVLQASSEGTWGGSNNLAAVLPTVLRPDGSVLGYTTTFHPSATAVSDAMPIALRSGDARSGIDVQLRPVALTRVSGTVVGPNGPEANFAVHLIPAFAANQIFERQHAMGVTVTNAGGAFSFLGVPPGSYVLKTWRLPQVLVIGRDALPPDTSLWVEAPLVIGNATLPPVTLTLRPGLAIAGRVVFEGAAPPIQPQVLQTVLSVAFEPESWPLAFGARMATRVSATGEFSTQGLPPGRYVPKLPNQFMPPARLWYFESATQAGQDLIMSPLVLASTNAADVVITLTDRRNELSGTILDALGRPAKNATVLLFPANYRGWLENGTLAAGSRIEAASQTGTYTIANMRPGEYLVAAVGDDELAKWPQTSIVAAIAATAGRVTIARGDVKRQDLRVK